jgi:hypothetical protein
MGYPILPLLERDIFTVCSVQPSTSCRKGANLRRGPVSTILLATHSTPGSRKVSILQARASSS